MEFVHIQKFVRRNCQFSGKIWKLNENFEYEIMRIFNYWREGITFCYKNFGNRLRKRLECEIGVILN